MRKLLLSIRDRYIGPQYPFKDRLYFLFGTAGLLSAAAAYAAAVGSGLPRIAAAASLTSFFVMLVLMTVSFFMKNISVNRVICSVFLNFFMFPILFWVTGGVNCGMVFYFILGLSVSALILDGKTRAAVLALALAFDLVCLDLGFRFPEMAYPLSYEERWMDTVSSFFIVALFIIAVIVIMSAEYQKEHSKVLEHAARLELQAITDSLTALYNRRYLTAYIEELAKVCGRDGMDAAILMLDIDDFKKINDTYGHQRGNQVLCRFAALLRESSGDAYTVARYGGEEFVVALPGLGPDAAVTFAEAVRRKAFQDRELSELTEGRFSVSIGVADYGGSSLDEWMRRADANLYAAKAQGKNRVVG